MSNLRQEYQKNKAAKDNIVTEAAVKWLDSNVIVINEKINRSSVNRLVNSIAKFEETFSPFEQKVPTITSIVDGCEENLQLVLTGKAGDKKTVEVLEYLSFVYNLFSTFFTKDLPVVLKAKMFIEAQQNPEVRLDSLTGNFNIDSVAKTFAHAIEPSSEEIKLVGRVLKSKSIPKIDSNKIASELMALSFNDLMELTTMSKVPLATTPKKLDSEDTIVSESYVINQQLLYEQKLLTEASIQEVAQKLGELKKIIQATGLNTLTQPVNDLHSKLLAWEATPVGQQAKQTISQTKDLKAKEIIDIFKTPGGKLAKQANMAIELFNSLGKSWPKIKEFVDKDGATEQDIASIKGILLKNTTSGFLKKAAQAFGIGTPSFPGLEPESVVNAIVSMAEGATKQEQIKRNKNFIKEQEAGTNTTTTTSAPTSTATPEKSANINLEKFKAVMIKLNSYSNNSLSQPTSGNQPASADNVDSKATTANKEKGLSQPTSAGEVDDAVKDAMNSLGSTKESTKNTVQQVVTALKKAGYTITKNK